MNNYLQLNIGGKLRGLKFNQLAYIGFYEKVSPKDYVGTFHYAAVYSALEANSYVKREEFEESYETVCDWVDAMSNEDKNLVTETFNNTAYFKKIVEEGEAQKENEQPKKKKLKSTTKTA